MKRLHKWIAMLAAVLMTATVGVACGPQGTEPVAKSFVAIDINPSITLTLDANDVVLSATADNEDASVLLYGEQLKGLPVEQAIDRIAELSVELGYLSEENRGISLTVSGTLDTEALTALAREAFDAHTEAFEPLLTTDGTFSLQVALERIKEQYPDNAAIQALDEATFRLIAEAMESDATLTVEAAVALSEEELIALIGKAQSAIEPFVTEQYEQLVAQAELAYREAIGQATDALWLVPYNNDLVGILTGTKKYDVHYGLIYNLYTASSRVLSAGIYAAELAAKTVQAVALPVETVDGIATALGLADEDKEAFLAAVSEDGKVTLASVSSYLDAWLKSMTAEQAEAAQAQIEAAKAAFSDVAEQFDESKLAAIVTAITEATQELNGLLSEELRSLAAAYVTEFESTVAAVTEAMSGKEPLAAAYAAKEVFDERAAQTLATMKRDLTKEDLESVERAIDAVQSLTAEAEAAFERAIGQAKTQAEAWLSSLRQERTAA